MDLKTWRRTQSDLRYRKALAYREDPEAVCAQEARMAAILALDNTACPVCGEEIHEAVACPARKKNICQAHCLTCRYHVKETPANNRKCRYKEKSSG